MIFRTLIERLKDSKLFKDSFWAVFGNGCGYALLLLAGIIIANFLGKDLYGEYGVVKTTMMYMASFAALGLGFTSTKYVAQYMTDDKRRIKSIIKATTIISFCSSGIIAIAISVFANELSIFLDEPSLSKPLRILALIIVCRAMSTAGFGILAGFGAFKQIGICNVISGLVMIVTAVPLTIYWGLDGALTALCVSQIILTILSYYFIMKNAKGLPEQYNSPMLAELFKFSIPVALQESSYTICNWGAILLLTKYSSVGEVGLYSAAAQWNMVVTFIPGALSNVILSHLSNASKNIDKHKRTIKLMLLTNIACTLVPFLFVFIFSDWISSLYGPSFVGLTVVMNVYLFETIFNSCSGVFHSELLAVGKNWTLFALRVSKDILLIGLVWIGFVYYSPQHGALFFVVVCLIARIIYILGLIACCYKNLRREVA